MEEFREFLKSLPKMSAKTMEALMERVEEMFPVGGVKSVEIDHSHVIVETVTAYGLEIELDAHGNAVTIEFPRSAQITELWGE